MNHNKPEFKTSTNHNQNEIKVNNQINITINLGDPLNLLALLTSAVIIKKVLKRKSQ